jgi:uncharacterized membrane protein
LIAAAGRESIRAMADVSASSEIARSPEDVFAYVAQLDRHSEWQAELISVKVETDGPTRKGTIATEVRKVPGGKVKTRYEMSEFDPPRSSSWVSLNGPVRPNGTFRVEPAGEGGSRISVEMDMVGHGLLGKLLLVRMARNNARKQVPKDMASLKQRLESGS